MRPTFSGVEVPDGLPPGSLITVHAEPVLWITDDPVPQAGPLFAQLLTEHDATRAWPLLLTELAVPSLPGIPDEALRGNRGRPWHAGELQPAEFADLDPSGVLTAQWNLLTGQGASGFDFGEDAIPAVPFTSWPGLAAPAVPGPDPDASAAEIAVSPDGVRELTSRADPPYLGLVPASDGATAITSVGWISQAGDAADVAVVVRSWQQRFGARLCSLGIDTLGLSVAWPPASAVHARHVAAEHFAFCPDLADEAAFDEYAEDLINEPVWTFWWDLSSQFI
jgi:hypothetical protein